jgi:hypothetical protein
MSIEENSVISMQKKQVFSTEQNITLSMASSIDTGLIVLSDTDKKQAKNIFDALSERVAYFIPASGSGSRMFDSLHQLIETGESSEICTAFFEEIEKLALYRRIPLETRKKLKQLDRVAVARYLLHRDGLNLSDKPKGLIAFHSLADGVLNAFQEHALQAKNLFPSGVMLHFTVRENKQDEVLLSIRGLGKKPIAGLEISFSHQDSNTDAYCFNENQEIISVDGSYLRKPAGHGALLQNLNALDANLVLIKNIDNVQHISRCAASNDVSKELIGTLKIFQKALLDLKANFSLDACKRLNSKYQWLSESEIDKMDEASFEEILLKPIRVCGMVKNEGAPGGGPFWINDNGVMTKQIIEKIQISSNPEQQAILAGSTHFNPVLIAACKADVYGNRLDLEEFSNKEKYLSVTKTFKGSIIRYRELPGLWNGGMHYWNTLFVEVPSNVFSPVKTVLDLLTPGHQAQ